jgi:hypothetical protein
MFIKYNNTINLNIMKTLFNTFIYAVALTATTFTAQANHGEAKKTAEFGTGIYATKTGKINLTVEKPDANANATIVLRNQKNEIFYRETVRKADQRFGRVLNVDALGEGKYEIQITSNGVTESRFFELTEKTLEKGVVVK